MILRDYQIEAVKSVSSAFQAGKKRIMLELGPGSGKSVIAAEMCRLAAKPEQKVLVLCHQKEILAQNQNALQKLAPHIDTSVYCDGMGEKSTDGEVIFAHRDSYSRLANPPRSSFVIIDECHMVSKKRASKYQRILEAVQCAHLVGLSATPYRLNGGIIFGKNKPFEIRAYKMGIEELVHSGNLTPYRFVECDPQVIAGTSKRIDEEALGAIASQDANLNNSVELIMKHTQDRMCSIIYCCSRLHARRIAEQVPGCAYIDGNSHSKDRQHIIDKMREGKIKHVANVGVLTTGVDVPICDTVVMLRPTLSASLYVQAIGRALRLHTDKDEALIIEMTDNLVRFGDINDPMDYGTNEIEELELSLGTECPTKECPGCQMEVKTPTRVCPHCNYMFLKPRENSSQERISINVVSYHIANTQTKAGHYAMYVTWKTEKGTITEWLNINHPNKWVAQSAMAKMKRLRRGSIKTIMVADLDKAFPKVHSYHS